MNMTWDLDIMYKGYKDEKYINDVKYVKELIEKLNELVSSLDSKDEKNVIENYLKYEEELSTHVSELYSYSSLRSAANVNDMEALEEISKLTLMLQETVVQNVKFKRFIKDVDLDKLALTSDVIKTYLFNLKNIKESSKHMLSPQEELLESKLQMVASSSWSDLQSQLTSNLKIKVKGFKETLPLSTVRNLAHDANKDVRKNAYTAELKAYKQIDASVAMALNNIKREVNIMCELRGYNSALEKTLKQSHMSEKTLCALIDAIKEEAPNFRKYFLLKAKALGYEKGLPFYELFAPMGHLTKTYTFEEAKELVLEVYKSFSDKLYEMGKRAFSERRIDVYPHEGKEGGAFCAGLDNHKQSRVLTNFTGSLGDVQTLAHELGHAYHGQVCLNNAVLNRDYPMQLAETASIFCQTLMAKKMINDITDPYEKLTVIEESLQEDTQCVIDILSRFLFEEKVLSTEVSKPLSATDMCEMMLEAQEESYGEGLDKKYRHPYMWLCKSHYYSASLNYYNFPYAFGLLYGKGLYKQYLKNKDDFVKKYDEMLMKTGYMMVEDVTMSMGIDVTKKDFWIESLKFIEEDIDEFASLLVATGLIKDNK